MTLDIQSLWLVGALCCFGSGLVVLVVKQAYRRDLDKVISAWSAANILLGVAFGLRFERAQVGQFLFYDFSAVLVAGSLSLKYLGICWLKHRKPLWGWIAGPPLTVLAVTGWFTFVQRNITMGLIFCNCVSLTLLIVLVWVLSGKEAKKRPLPDVAMAFACSVLSTALAWVIFRALHSGQLMPEYDYNQPRAIASMIATIATGAVVFPLFLMMIFDRLNRSLAEQAMRDSLTGLYNRRAFEEIAGRELAASARTGLPLSLIIFDLDHFKEVNDALGHATGDAVLIQATQTIRHSLREEDILCRWGGDEFCALLPRTAREKAVKAVDRVRKAFVETHFEAEGHVFDLAVSIGVASEEHPGKDVAALIRKADTDLYLVKKARKRALAVGATEAITGPQPLLR